MIAFSVTLTTTPAGGIPIPNNMGLASADVLTTAAIFQARTLNGTNAVMAFNSAGGGVLVAGEPARSVTSSVA